MPVVLEQVQKPRKRELQMRDRTTKGTSETLRSPSGSLSFSLCRPSIGDRMMVPARRIPAVPLETLVADKELKPKSSVSRIQHFGT